jgi:hypothetical protein
MAKSQVQARVPRNTEEQIKRYQHEEGIEAESEAARQLIEAGVRAQGAGDGEPGPGERLAETATAIAGVGGLTAALAAFTGSTVGLSLVIPFLMAAFLFAVLWASIKLLGGGELV